MAKALSCPATGFATAETLTFGGDDAPYAASDFRRARGPVQTILMHAYRSHTCGALRASDAGSAVRLSGWVHRKRDHGGLLFIDLRDHYGLTQLVLHPETPGFAAVERLRAESVIRVDGEVVARDASVVNPNLPTGEIEVRVRGVEVLSEAAELPLPVFGEPDYPEAVSYTHLTLPTIYSV